MTTPAHPHPNAGSGEPPTGHREGVGRVARGRVDHEGVSSVAAPPLVLRIDDIGPYPGQLTRAGQLLDVVDAFDVPVLLAANPCYGQVPTVTGNPPAAGDLTEPDPTVWQPLRTRLTGRPHQVVFHGLTHRCHLRPADDHDIERGRGHRTNHEFACRDHGTIGAGAQAAWLQAGTDMLYRAFGATTDVLIPPAHYYEPATLTAMRETGYRHIATYDRYAQQPWTDPATGITTHPCDVVDLLRLFLVIGLDATVALARNTARSTGRLQLFWHTSYPGHDYNSPGPFPAALTDAAATVIEAIHGERRQFTTID